jgi:hypothetical protein
MPSMTAIPVLFLSVSLLIAVIALVRERRLRRALQILLARLLSRWRHHGPNSNTPSDINDPANRRLPE